MRAAPSTVVLATRRLGGKRARATARRGGRAPAALEASERYGRERAARICRRWRPSARARVRQEIAAVDRLGVGEEYGGQGAVQAVDYSLLTVSVWRTPGRARSGKAPCKRKKPPCRRAASHRTLVFEPVCVTGRVVRSERRCRAGRQDRLVGARPRALVRVSPELEDSTGQQGAVQAVNRRPAAELSASTRA